MTLVGSNYATAGVIARRRGSKLEFLVMDTERIKGRNKGRRLTQFPMEKAEVEDQGNPEKTLRAGLIEEVGLRIKPGTVPELLHYEVAPEDGHVKMFYLIWRSACRGTIRKDDLLDRRSKLGVPYWVDLETLKNRLCSSHRSVIGKLEQVVVRPLAA